MEKHFHERRKITRLIFSCLILLCLIMIDLSIDLNVYLAITLYYCSINYIYESFMKDIFHISRITVYNDSLGVKDIFFINTRYYFIKGSYMTFTCPNERIKATGTFKRCKKATGPLVLSDKYNENLMDIAEFINDAIKHHFQNEEEETKSLESSQKVI